MEPKLRLRIFEYITEIAHGRILAISPACGTRMAEVLASFVRVT